MPGALCGDTIVSAEDYLAQIDAIIERYGKAIEAADQIDKPAIYEAAIADLKALKANAGDAARWLRAKGYPPKEKS